ncbi:MAG: valine--tRNA ligase [Candidatus Wildermuthbacteria bacterium RIFCSPHIGHO2_02_FULL_45_25]|uniref:Valine--tRNA ligase n=1 Tax=Candidatus Wildermuthbacteria bacterium RIFCSPHIGHO2_02_FULL_45_25 TaxID=1802450 RepID=A0A1G2QZN7_9BACT|nr:MAG: valine--tRNA ligase [Candidatus Wildermuthbacteria bacterium RIFCSPHIGHO2_02_FULL_45_25]
MKEIAKAYNSKETEDRIYKMWEESGFFNPDVCVKKGIAKPNAESYSIVLPPPNVTGTLHMGHAAMLAIEDILIRAARMQGKKTLWIPGTDHAAIATQAKVESDLYKKEKKTRRDLGREEFLKLVEAFAKESHDTIIHQLRKMGSSLDWTREAFTLDDKRNMAVRTAFKRMHDDGLIYRGARIVNWDPKMQTTVSDDEIEWIEEQGKFYYLKYGPFVIGTSRPETKFGDKYVVLHPDDNRYKQYKHGQQLQVEWINGPITATVIKDTAVDMEFGTGAMTITPWHDATDFDIAQRHRLDKQQIIDFQGKLLPIAGEFAGLHISKARQLIVEKLQNKGLVDHIDEKYTHRLATNSRGGGIIEPQIKEQWFVAVNKPFTLKESHIPAIPSESETTLKELIRKTVESKQIAILPERFEKTYYHWIDNLRDWCISRQIWYGHRVPVWYRDKETYAGVQAPEGEKWEQDPDTLDTWFSSGLWTFSTLGWPEQTQDLKTYHPTTVLETGYDILFFWVARMILMAGYHTGNVPFRNVYLHGLVRDDQGRKMSKSLGNIINPLDMIEKYGADATRLSLIIGAAPGNDIKLSEDKVRGYKYFTNKIWNVSRFILLNTEGEVDLAKKPQLTPKQEQLLEELKKLSQETTQDIANFRLYLAGEKLYHYFWHRFADVIIEESKPAFRQSTGEEKISTQWLLLAILTTLLKLLHPFTPFVTEEIYQHLPILQRKQLLMVEQWPIL